MRVGSSAECAPWAMKVVSSSWSWFLLLLFSSMWVPMSESYYCQVVGDDGSVQSSVHCSTEMNTRDDFLTFSQSNYYPTIPQVQGPASKILIDARDTSSPNAYFFDLNYFNGHAAFSSAMGIGTSFSSCPNCDPCPPCPIYGRNWCSYSSTCPSSSSGTRCSYCNVYGNTKRFYAIDFQSYIDVDLSVIFCISWNEQDPIKEMSILFALQTVQKYLHFLGTERVAFCRTATDSTLQTTDTVRQQILTMGYEILDAHNPYGKRAGAANYTLGPLPPLQFYWAMHEGETWGNLVLFPHTSVLDPYDIPVFDVVPLDLGVVAGVITTVQQTVNSHINLKSNERDTPNMVLTNLIANFSCFLKCNNTSVHLLVTDDGFLIESSTIDQVMQKQKDILDSKFWVPLYHDTSDALLSYDEMCSEDPTPCLDFKRTYGTKAANLGFVRNKHVLGRTYDAGSLSSQLNYNVTPHGFGIPFQYYKNFLDYPPNRPIRDLIQSLSDLEIQGKLDPFSRGQYSDKLKKMFWNAEVPPSMVQAIRAKAAEVYSPLKINRLKFRSSSNAEDLPGFDGAGLYDSFSVKLKDTSSDNNNTCVYDPVIDDMVPPTLQCALKGVYGSLYNTRAIEERTYARFTHNSCLMGISVVSRYGSLGNVTGNAVGITLLPGASAHTGYSWSLQDGDNDVTNPNPGTVSETSYSIFDQTNSGWNWRIERYAITTINTPPVTKNVVPFSLMDLALRSLLIVEEAYCTYALKLSSAVCSQIRYNTVKRGLDAEFKFLDNSRIHFKQVREFNGYSKVSKYFNFSTTTNCSWKNEASFRGPNGEAYENVAFHKNTTQHSTAFGQNSSFAVDGIVAGLASYTSLTDVGNGVWWEVDLGDVFMIFYIRIWGRSDCCFDQLKNFQIDFTFEDGTKSSLPLSYASGSRSYLIGPSQIQPVASLPVRKIRIIQKDLNPLALAEVQVYSKAIVSGDPSMFVLPVRVPIPFCEWGNWTEWSPCSQDCDGGNSTRQRSFNDWCTNYDLGCAFEMITCNTEPCCEVGLWSDWSPCSCNGTSFRTRPITIQGPNCPPTISNQPCDPPKSCFQPSSTPTPSTPSNTPTPTSEITTPTPSSTTSSTTSTSTPTTSTTSTSTPTPSNNIPTVLVSFVLSGNSNLTHSQLSDVLTNILQAHSSVPISVTVTTEEGSNTTKVTVSTTSQTESSNKESSSKLEGVLKDQETQQQVLQQTGTSIVSDSVKTPTSSSSDSESPSSSTPFWVWVVVGIGCFVVVAAIVLVVIKVKSSRNEIV